MVFGNNTLMRGNVTNYTNARVIYSLRKVNPNYNGVCLRVRRSLDNAEMDVGFVNGVLDTASLLTFVGSGTGYVRTWYDQSGNTGFDIGQASNSYQPIIVSSGALIYNGSKICINSQGKYLTNTSVNFGLINRTMLMVFSTTDALNASNYPRGVFGIGNTGTSDYAANNSYLFQLSRANMSIGCAPTDGYIVGADSTGGTTPNAGYYLLPFGNANTNNVSIVAEVKDHYAGSVYFNEVLKSQNTSFTAFGEFQATSANGFVLGSRWYAPASYPANVKLQEFIYFNETKTDYAAYSADINQYYTAY